MCYAFKFFTFSYLTNNAYARPTPFPFSASHDKLNGCSAVIFANASQGVEKAGERIRVHFFIRFKWKDMLTLVDEVGTDDRAFFCKNIVVCHLIDLCIGILCMDLLFNK